MKIKHLILVVAMMCSITSAFAENISDKITLTQQITTTAVAGKETSFATYEVSNIFPAFPVTIQSRQDIPNLPANVSIASSTCNNSTTTCQFTLAIVADFSRNKDKQSYQPAIKIGGSIFNGDTCILPQAIAVPPETISSEYTLQAKQISTSPVETSIFKTVFAQYTLTTVSGFTPNNPTIDQDSFQPGVSLINNTCNGTKSTCTFDLAIASLIPRDEIDGYSLKVDIGKTVITSQNTVEIPKVVSPPPAKSTYALDVGTQTTEDIAPTYVDTQKTFATYTLKLVTGNVNPNAISIVNTMPGVTIVNNTCDGSAKTCTFNLAIDSSQPQTAVNAYLLTLKVGNPEITGSTVNAANNVIIPAVLPHAMENLDTTISAVVGPVNPLVINYHFVNNQTVTIDAISIASSVSARVQNMNDCTNIAPGASCDMQIAFNPTQSGYSILPKIEWTSGANRYTSSTDNAVFQSVSKLITQDVNSQDLLALTPNTVSSGTNNQLILARNSQTDTWQPMSIDLSTIRAAHINVDMDNSSYLYFSDLTSFIDPQTNVRKAVAIIHWNYNNDWRSVIAVNDIGGTGAWTELGGQGPLGSYLVAVTAFPANNQSYLAVATATGLYTKAWSDSSYKNLVSRASQPNVAGNVFFNSQNNKLYYSSMEKTNIKIYEGDLNNMTLTYDYSGSMTYAQNTTFQILKDNIYASINHDYGWSDNQILQQSNVSSTPSWISTNRKGIAMLPIGLAGNGQTLVIATTSSFPNDALYQSKDGINWTAMSLPSNIQLPLTGLVSLPTSQAVQVIDSNKKRFLITLN